MGGEPVKGDEVMEVNGESAGKGREEAGVKGERGKGRRELGRGCRNSNTIVLIFWPINDRVCTAHGL